MSENIRIINAAWEKRNLGIDVYEVIINKFTKITELGPALSLNKDLVYVKVHCNNLDVIEKFLNAGFIYVENQFSILKRLQNFFISETYTKNLRFLEPKTISLKKEFEVIFNELDKGLFTTDRIAVDNKFGIETSNLRYKNWITDLIGSDDHEIVLVKTKKDKTPVSFFINKYEGKIAKIVLGGVFSDFKGRGISHSFMYFSIINAIAQNCRILKTQISGNNISVFSIYSSVFGFEISDNYVVLKKHKTNIS